jgi:hypothetical protein
MAGSRTRAAQLHEEVTPDRRTASGSSSRRGDHSYSVFALGETTRCSEFGTASCAVGATTSDPEPKSRTTIPTPPPPQWTGAPEATDRGAGSDARAGSPHPLTAAAGAVTTTPAGTGTGSTRTRSVHSSAGLSQCCPRRLLERAVRLLPRQQRRHRLAAVSWHSPKARLAHRGPVALAAGGTRCPPAHAGPLQGLSYLSGRQPNTPVVMPCARAVGEGLGSVRRPARRGAHPQSGCLRGRTQ